MLKIVSDSIIVILKSEGFFKKFIHGLTWAALSIMTLAVIAILIHNG